MPGLIVLANEEEVILAQYYLLIGLDLFLSSINPSLIASHSYGLFLARGETFPSTCNLLVDYLTSFYQDQTLQ